MAKPTKVTSPNRYGIQVVHCCASCVHHAADTEDTRICTKGYGTVRPSFLCQEHYEMEDRYDNAGKGGGFIKKKHYLRFVYKYEHPAGTKKTAMQIREEYKKKFGSPYIDGRNH